MLLLLQQVTVKMTTTVTTAFHSAAGGIGVTYTKDQDSSDNAMAVTYSAGALSLSMTALDETGAETGAGGRWKPNNNYSSW